MNKACKIQPVHSKLPLFLCHSHQGLISVGGFCEAFTLLPFHSPAVAMTSRMQLDFFLSVLPFVKQPFSWDCRNWKFSSSLQFKVPNCLSSNTVGRCFSAPTAGWYFPALRQNFKIREWQRPWNTSCPLAYLRNDALNIHCSLLQNVIFPWVLLEAVQRIHLHKPFVRNRSLFVKNY